MEQLKRLVQAVDDVQQRHRWLAFPMAVVKKYGEDQAGQRAALLAYYGFFSLFPLLLVAVTVIGFVLQGHADLGQRVVDSAVAQFPVVGDEISGTVSQSRLRGSGAALVVGLALTLWGGLGVAEAAQSAMNGIWNVPRRRYPSFLLRRLRGLAWLVILGGGLLLASVVSGVAAAADTAWSGAAGVAASTLVNMLLFLIGFRVLTVRNVSAADAAARGGAGRHRLGAAPVAGRLVRGPPAQPGERHLRRLRPGHRPAVVAVPGLDGDPAGGRAERGPEPAAVAPEPGPAAAGRARRAGP
jgi:uncharacterized BrkB/YihY/UPF0761 family membrane protein